MSNAFLGQMGDYEIKQLKVFKTIVECGGFAAAETRLNISRSTISNHIANLES
ncbi:MAG: LysR family transcriptional regulator, partial [Gammaproteobacteria bacterium]|nr:LysR family transcriptional regulator [Gammaproteobacteria bacterium]